MEIMRKNVHVNLSIFYYKGKNKKTTILIPVVQKKLYGSEKHYWESRWDQLKKNEKWTPNKENEEKIGLKKKLALHMNKVLNVF